MILDYQDKEHLPFNHTGSFLVLFLAIFMGSLLVMGGVIFLVNTIIPTDIQQLLSASDIKNTADNRLALRWTLLITHLFQFIIPGLVISYITLKTLKNKIQYKWPLSFKIVILSALLLIASIPFLQFTQWINTILPLPNGLMEMENSTNAILKIILTMDTSMDVIITLLLVALIPSIGEEYIFRGLIQAQLNKVIKNPHIGIWLTAIAFSAMHMQFNGFLPRLFLGLVLGYIFYWSKNLGVPIIVHFLFNGTQVLVQYYYKMDIETISPDAFDDLHWYNILVSITLMIITAYFLYADYKKNNLKNEYV